MSLTDRQTVVPPGVCDAERGRADRCVCGVRESRALVVRNPLTELRLCSGELGLEHRDAGAGRVYVGRDAQRTHAEGAVLPGGAHGGRNRHDAGRVHRADGDEKVLRGVLGSHRVLND